MLVSATRCCSWCRATKCYKCQCLLVLVVPLAVLQSATRGLVVLVVPLATSCRATKCYKVLVPKPAQGASCRPWWCNAPATRWCNHHPSLSSSPLFIVIIIIIIIINIIINIIIIAIFIIIFIIPVKKMAVQLFQITRHETGWTRQAAQLLVKPPMVKFCTYGKSTHFQMLKRDV